jgi:hypothetical protein
MVSCLLRPSLLLATCNSDNLMHPQHMCALIYQYIRPSSPCLQIVSAYKCATVRYLHCSLGIPSWFSAEGASFSVSEHFHWAMKKLYNSPILHSEIFWLFKLKSSEGGNMFKQPFSIDILSEQFHWKIAWLVNSVSVVRNLTCHCIKTLWCWVKHLRWLVLPPFQNITCFSLSLTCIYVDIF